MLLQLVALERLRVFNLFLGVLVGLQDLVVLLLTLLQILVHLVFELLAQGTHLILLLLHEFSLGCQDLLVSCLHVRVALLLFELVCALLYLMSLLIILLLGQVCLNLAHVQKLSGEFECHWESLFKLSAILLELSCMVGLKLLNLGLVLLLSFRKDVVPMLIELLVLLDVSSLDLFLSLLMTEYQCLVLHVVLLFLQLKDAILGHLSLYIV